MAGPDTLRQVDLFAGMDREELDELSAKLRSRRYQRGEVVFLRGDPGTALYIVQSGRVKISLASADGKELILALHGPGEFFGELALLDDQPRSADAVAVEPTELHLLQRDDFRQVLAQRPQAAARLLTVLSGRLRRNTDLVEDSTFLDVPGRLARALLQLAEANGRLEGDGVVIGTRLTQSDLAGMVGATRESVNKWLGFYERQGMLRSDRGRIVILRPQALRQRIY